MSDFKLADGFVATPERFLWHPASGTAILSDVHLGVEAELTRLGIFMPDVSDAALQHAWRRVCGELGRAKGGGHLVIAGDFFDAAAPDSKSLATARELFQALPANCRITLIPGNHDPCPEVLAELLRGIPMTIAPAAAVGGYAVIHGHQSDDALGVGDGHWLGDGQDRQWILRGLILGHQHPAVILQNRVQQAKMICYASWQFKVKIIAASKKNAARRVPAIILPTFSRMALGSNLTERHWIVDLPRPQDEDVRILGIVDGDRGGVLDFGTLDRLRLPF